MGDSRSKQDITQYMNCSQILCKYLLTLAVSLALSAVQVETAMLCHYVQEEQQKGLKTLF